MYKLLLADDEYFIRYGLEHTIKWEEYGIEICGSVINGLEALEVFRQEQPDIVITDVKMPEMNGLELIKAIRESGHDTKVIVISGYNDFDYVKETLVYGVENYILKPIDEDELSETVLNTLDKIEKEKDQVHEQRASNNYIVENVFNRLITNSIAVKEVEERFDFFDIDMKATGYAVCVINFIEEEQKPGQVDKEKLMVCMQDELKSYKKHIFYDLSGSLVIVLCFGDEGDYARLVGDRATKDIISMFNDMDTDVFVTIGNEVKEMGLIHRSYHSAVFLQEYIYIYSKNTMISYDKINKVKKKLNNIFDTDIEGFRAHLKAGNRYEVERYFFDVKQKALLSEGSTINYIRSYLIELVAVLINVIKDKQLWSDREVIYPDKLYEKLFGEGDLRSTIAWLRDISLKIVDSIVADSTKPASLQEEVIAYINGNYSKDISLKVIASEFYVNPSYLGQTFKKETGKLFSTYLNELRIEKAKELMANTKMKASHIATEVGYRDANYFYKVFKKYTGVYPSEYQ